MQFFTFKLLTCFRTLDSHFPLLSLSRSLPVLPWYHTPPPHWVGCVLSSGWGGQAVLITGFGNGLLNWCNFAEWKISLFRGTSVAEQRESNVPSWRFLENTLVSKLSWNDSSLTCFQSCFFLNKMERVQVFQLPAAIFLSTSTKISWWKNVSFAILSLYVLFLLCSNSGWCVPGT